MPTPTQIDITEAVMAILKADSGVQTFAQAKIYDTDLPLSEDLLMPQNAIVVRRAGGAARFSQGTLQLLDPRVNTISYGKTVHLAQSVDTAIYYALKDAGPGVFFGTYIHWIKPAMLGNALRDPDTQWAYVVSSWIVLAADQPIAS